MIPPTAAALGQYELLFVQDGRTDTFHSSARCCGDATNDGRTLAERLQREGRFGLLVVEWTEARGGAYAPRFEISAAGVKQLAVYAFWPTRKAKRRR